MQYFLKMIFIYLNENYKSNIKLRNIVVAHQHLGELENLVAMHMWTDKSAIITICEEHSSMSVTLIDSVIIGFLYHYVAMDI